MWPGMKLSFFVRGPKMPNVRSPAMAHIHLGYMGGRQLSIFGRHLQKLWTTLMQLYYDLLQDLVAFAMFFTCTYH